MVSREIIVVILGSTIWKLQVKVMHFHHPVDLKTNFMKCFFTFKAIQKVVNLSKKSMTNLASGIFVLSAAFSKMSSKKLPN